MCSCHSILECCVRFSGVKLSIRSFVLFIRNNQFGFQKNRSTSLAILDVQAKIIEAIEQKQIACSVFLTWRKHSIQ